MSLNEIFGSTTGSNSFEGATGKIGSSVEAIVAKASWLSETLRPWGMASIVAGFAVAGIGATFAIAQGASVALALMAAYCVVATCIACTVTLALLSQRSPREVVAKPSEPRPNIAAWRLVSELRVSDACRLWCDIEPGSPYSQEAIAWATAMLDAIKKGELPVLSRAGGQKDIDERERTNPSWRTRVSRDDLKAWAASHGFRPAFLAS